MNRFSRNFRRYHRGIALIVALPLLVTILTGVSITILREWPGTGRDLSSFSVKIHTGEILHLAAIYPILNGLGLLGLLVTGLSMTSLFGRRPRQQDIGDR
jgi:hypothetical protein